MLNSDINHLGSDLTSDLTYSLRNYGTRILYHS